MKFSIIIPTYNEAADIAATLEALLGLDYGDKEIIVVDDSTDRTPEIVRRYVDRGVRLIHPGGGGRCEARNLGIREAAGEVVVAAQCRRAPAGRFSPEGGRALSTRGGLRPGGRQGRQPAGPVRPLRGLRQ